MSIVVLVVQILYILRPTCAGEEHYPKIPESLALGSATSAYQIEGAWNVSDKSESIWDRWTHINATYWGNGDTGDIATDFYHKYKEDVQTMKHIGFDHFRFSISWSRVLPHGTPDRPSKDGVRFYHNLIDELLANKIVPYVTMHHFDDVQLLVDKTGGWNNESMVEYFAGYSRFLYKEFGSKVKFWVPINEKDIFCILAVNREETESNAIKVGRYKCVHNLIKAHARAYRIYDKEFRKIQGGQVGLHIQGSDFVPKTPNDHESARIAFEFETGWIMNPVYSKNGDYPDVMKQRIAENSKVEGLASSRLPKFSQKWINYIKGSSDFLGFNHYMSYVVESVPKVNGRWTNDSGIGRSYDPAWEMTDAEFTIVPEGIRKSLERIRDNYNNPPVYILESGMSGNITFYDTDRTTYLYSFMKQVLLAIRNGCDVRSYAIWSLLDNFEWNGGYHYRFGIVHVDFTDPNRTRTPKFSSHWVREVLKKRRLIPWEKMPELAKFRPSG